MGLGLQIWFGQTNKFLGWDIPRRRQLCLPSQILCLDSGQGRSQERPWVVVRRSCGAEGLEVVIMVDNVQDESGRKYDNAGRFMTKSV